LYDDYGEDDDDNYDDGDDNDNDGNDDDLRIILMIEDWADGHDCS
jgi:hypothetical protein